MTLVNIATLLETLAEKRGSIKRASSSKQSVSEITKEYQEVWDTFNRYVSATLAEGKTINVTNFCKIGYINVFHPVKGQLPKDTRPFFSLAESFCKSFSLGERGKRLLHLVPSKDCTPVEEFNFSKAAIKYSTSLTKDQAFTGLRYIVQNIGESMAANHKLLVEFECGKLVWSESKAKFVFDKSFYQQRGLSTQDDTFSTISGDVGLVYKPSITFGIPSEDALKLRLDAAAKASPEVSEKCQVKSQVDVLPMMNNNQCDNSQNSSLAVQPTSSRSSSNSSSQRSLSCTAPDFRPSRHRQDLAYRNALNRHLSVLESKADEAVKSRQNWEDFVSECIKQDADDLAKKKSLCSENAMYLSQQIQWNESRRTEDRKQWIEGASAHEFPRFANAASSERTAMQKHIQLKMRGELDMQVRTNNALRDMSRDKERMLEEEQMKSNIMRMRDTREHERKKKQEERKILEESWDREVKLRRMWKTIEKHGNAPASKSLLIDDVLLSARSNTSSINGNTRRAPVNAAMSLKRKQYCSDD